MRDIVILSRSPDTLASTAAFTAGLNVGDVLDGNFDERAMTCPQGQALQDRKGDWQDCHGDQGYICACSCRVPGEVFAIVCTWGVLHPEE